jgi:lactate permease
MGVWHQIYDPFNNPVLSTLLAALPIVTLLLLIASNKLRAHIAALIVIGLAIAVAVLGFTMPLGMALRAAGLGALSGLFPIGWIILNVIFLYRLTVEKGVFATFQHSLGSITADRRLQLLLIAFCFGAFFEGAAGFGTPVAVAGTMLIGLGFSPLAAAGLSLLANTAPVAFGALGAPITGLSTATGLDPFLLGQLIGRQSTIFSMLIPFWLIWAFCGWRRMIEVWPAILVAALSFAVPQFLFSNYVNPYIVDLPASVCSMAGLILFLKMWRPKEIYTATTVGAQDNSHGTMAMPAPAAAGKNGREIVYAWVPWIILCVVLSIWASSALKGLLNPLFAPVFPIEGLDRLVMRMPPVVAKPTVEPIVFTFSFLTYSGTGVLVAAILSGLWMGFSPLALARHYVGTIWVVRYSLVTISSMFALGMLTRYSGLDGTLGLAFARTGMLYPFFGTLLGWVGVAGTGSDTSSNVLFGGLQKITAQQLGLPVLLMAAANSTGGVMGKMIDAQSIVVATTATGWFGHEGKILRFVFWHSVVLASLVGALVMLQAYIWPFTAMVPGLR